MEVVRARSATFVYPHAAEARRSLVCMMVFYGLFCGWIFFSLPGHSSYEDSLLKLIIGFLAAAAAVGFVANTCRRVVFDHEARVVRFEVPVLPWCYVASFEHPLAWVRGYRLDSDSEDGSPQCTVQLVGRDSAHPIGFTRTHRAALEAAELIRGVGPCPVAIVEPVVQGRTGQCQVCGTSGANDWVCCDTCETPHHRECWSYNARCSTYGCRSTRALRLVTT